MSLQIHFKNETDFFIVLFSWGGYPMADGGPKEINLDTTSAVKSKFNIVDMVTGSTHCLLLTGTV